MSVNPYEPPMGESFDPKGVAELAEVDRDGNSVVVLVPEDRAVLPARCVLTGAATNILKHTAYVDASTRAVMARQFRFSMRFVPVEYWLDEKLALKQVGRERFAQWICLLAGASILVSFVIVCVAAFAFDRGSWSQNQRSFNDTILTILVLGSIGAFLISGFNLAGVLHGPFRVVRVLGRRIWLGGASEEFLDAIDSRNPSSASANPAPTSPAALIKNSIKVH